MKHARVAFWLLLATSFARMMAAEPSRQEVSLNGTWECQQVAELTTPPESGTWNTMEVPGTLRGYDNERAWLRTEFVLPAEMRGKRIKIQFDGVKYNSRIFVNGKHVGGCFNGYDAFEVDATDAVHYGAANQLAVGFHDWTGVFSPGTFDFSKKPVWQRARRYAADKVIAPIGGHYDYYGIWGDVRLIAHPNVYVSNLFIKPSVRRGELVVDYTVTNESADSCDVNASRWCHSQK